MPLDHRTEVVLLPVWWVRIGRTLGVAVSGIVTGAYPVESADMAGITCCWLDALVVSG
jgi:hypothetical protein